MIKKMIKVLIQLNIREQNRICKLLEMKEF